MAGLDHHSAPMLAAEEQARGDALVERIQELQEAGQNTGFHHMAVQNAYGNAAKYSPQPPN